MMTENGKVYSRIVCVFGAVNPPAAQRAIGYCSPLKESPGTGPAVVKIFHNRSKIIIWIENCYSFVIFTDVFLITFQ